ncbi:DeoR/GlpR family DNA-binding transcription regulator [Rhizobium laguerreae]|uniref:DeoR/GlpR family DNA-binding transcription regulator n=1 Tax=Rhizobium laguerreae TaxID=1076926 RepID=UPI001C920CC2|nr:DeoR/GlpR family DNA-binding transcription regulator [Rhizobium laguerreae]MBY3196712.1 DeoR/GlpR transcriptional regulator [Rhizobium laguerreae]MBY3230293.1 DeoR/GlpR transcriptional regulator [Rhizobium laguerreae]MBY3560372.1 DeoR/GlpR transcriptional regulator [Rhizobium laguerreae]
MGQRIISSRQREILALIEAEGVQYIEELARRYDLTTQTIRRDINALCDLGHARRFHGGVDLPVEGSNISLNARAQLNRRAKRLIAKRVASDIGAEATVFLGIGSTVRFVAEALRDHQGLTVITNNIHVALSLCDAPSVEVHLTGGLLRHDDRDVVGTDVIKFVEKFYATYAVVGAGALSPLNGLMDFSYSEAQITNALLENSQMQILAADVSKWTRNASVRVAPFSKLTRFYTDRLPGEAAATNALAESGLDVVTCSEDMT